MMRILHAYYFRHPRAVDAWGPPVFRARTVEGRELRAGEAVAAA